MYLLSFNNFRGLAILLIVAGHCYGISGWQIDTFFERVIANIVTGGTSLFVFISGFLFHHVFYPKYNYRRFMTNKVRNVLFPYLFLSIFAIAQALIIRGPFPEMYFGAGNTFSDQLLRPALLYLFTGGVFAYWYIPFIMCIFALSPFFNFFIHRSRGMRISITCCFLVISLFLHRPVNNFLVPQSVLFFIPVYLFGILCSMEKEMLYEKLADKIGLLLATVLSFAILQSILFDACGNLQKPPLQFNGIDINLIQKLLQCLLLMVYLERFKNLNSRILSALASSSFAIYFLHGWFIYGFSLLQKTYAPLYGLHLLPLLTVLVIACSYVAALAVRTALPKKSRMLIGW
jgi:hypothetical protein